MAEGRVQRRLAAIMAADVVGYSRLMENDEELTRARLKVLHYELIDPQIAADGGRIVKTMGDGILVEFPSVVDAVRNGLAIQKESRRRNAKVAKDKRIDLRVGINVGDVIIEGEDIHGDGVNIAARLEGLCEPGEVYVSGAAYDQADGKLEASFEDLGEQKVKNIEKPVRVYRASDEAKLHTVPESRLAEALSLPNKPSIAVLPFDNLSDDPQQEYFSDGMAEDLITDISKISGVSVAARNSSFAFKGQAADVKEIAKQLGVKHIVEGSVRKMGDRLRINAQLIDGADGRHIWAERYDGNMAEIFDFQDDIRSQIVSALQVSLTPTDRALTKRKPTESVEAYDLFLKGRANFHRYTNEHVLDAMKFFEKAIEVDPNFAVAYGYLSYCHLWGWAFMWPGFENSLERAHDLAERGVALDGASAMALARLGWLQTYFHRYDQASENLEKALTLANDDAEVFATYGIAQNWLGDPEKALEMLEKAISLDTFAPPTWEFNVGVAHYLLRQYDEALSNLNRMIVRSPKFGPAYLWRACVLLELGQAEDARKEIKAALEITPKYTIKQVDKMWHYRIDEFRNRFLGSLRKAGLPEG
jgi:adenylate cyclase